MGGSTIVVVDGKGSVDPRTTPPPPQFYCWIDGGDFVLSRSKNHQYVSNLYKNRSYYLSNLRRDYHYSTSDDGEGGIGVRTPPPPPKDNFGRDSNYGGFHKSQNHCTEYPKELFRSRDNAVGASYGYLFAVPSVYGKGGVGPRITYHNSNKVDCWIDVGIFVSSRSREHKFYESFIPRQLLLLIKS